MKNLWLSIKKTLQNPAHLFFISGMISIIGLSIFASRSFVLNKVDIKHLEDLYSHSQWSIPLSTRIISDSYLYQVSGYRLLKGASAFSISAEVPPFSKYLYGLGIKWWENPYLISTALYLSSILLFSAISFKIFSDEQLAQLSILLFSLSPILVNQISQTTMDLPQLVFLLVHVLAILYLDQSRTRHRYFSLLLAAGISLGLFAATKVPVLVLPILSIDFLYLKKSKKIISLLLISMITGIVYFSSYAPTLITQKMSILSWIKSQLWMINFYKISQVENKPIYYLSSIFAGVYKGWWGESGWQYIREWTLLWPVSIMAAIKLGFDNFSKKKSLGEVKYALNLATILLLIWLAIPFWSRYFLLVIPFLVICLVKIFENRKKILLAMVVISAAWLSFYLLPNPTSTLNIIQEKFNAANYQDFYDLVETDLNRNDFYLTLKDIQVETLSEKISLEFVNPPQSNPFAKNFELDAQIKYQTPIGEYKQKCKMPIIRKQNQWKVTWNWDCLAPGFQPGDTLKTTISYAQQGDLVDAKGKVLSEWAENNFILVDTQKIGENGQQLKTNLSTALGIMEARIEKKLYIDYKGSSKAPLGFILPLKSEEIMSQLQSNPAISLETRPARIYNSDLSFSDLEIVKSIEKNHPELFGKNGGEFVFINKGETNVLISSEVSDGQDVKLENEIKN